MIFTLEMLYKSDSSTSDTNLSAVRERMNFSVILNDPEEPVISLEIMQRQFGQESIQYDPSGLYPIEVGGEKELTTSRWNGTSRYDTNDSGRSDGDRHCMRLPSFSELVSGHLSSVTEKPVPDHRQFYKYKRALANDGPLLQVRSSESPLSRYYDDSEQESVQSDAHQSLSPTSDLSVRRSSGPTNQPYLREHLHCVRYLKEDLHLPWSIVYHEFNRIFSDQPGFIERDSEAALTSRSYRDNFVYAHTGWELSLNENGAPIRVKARVRSRVVGDEKEYPFKLVEKHPSWAVTYSWVKSEHKVRAQAILDGVDQDYYNSPRDRHRRLIEEAEEIEESLIRKLPIDLGRASTFGTWPTPPSK